MPGQVLEKHLPAKGFAHLLKLDHRLFLFQYQIRVRQTQKRAKTILRERRWGKAVSGGRGNQAIGQLGNRA